MANLEERICEQCGKLYVPTHHCNKYCSEECRYTAKKKRIRENNKKAYEKMKVKEDAKRCLVCRRWFKTNRKDVVTCSPYCQEIRMKEWRKEYRKKKRIEETKKREITKPMSIAEFNRRAREKGMTYGQYELYLRMEGQKRNAI